MKIIFQALAHYNRSVNESMGEILTGLSKDQLFNETKAFYRSIYDTCIHLLQSDIFWLKRYKAVYPDNDNLKNNELLLMDVENIRKEFESDYKKIFETQKKTDILAEQFINDLTEENYTQAFQYTNYKGVTTERIVWKTLLHWFNHQTHHRGQISAFLDIMGVKNDYSSLLPRI
jgi:uncharacterized damage-inducible protein DinB